MEFKHIFSGCWPLSGLSLYSDSVYDFYGQVHSWGEESVQFGAFRITSLLFADDVVLLLSFDYDLQHAPGWFIGECEVARMRVSSSKSMVLCWKSRNCFLWSQPLPQVKRFKYIWVLFTSGGKIKHEVNTWTGVASAKMWVLYQTILVKR